MKTRTIIGTLAVSSIIVSAARGQPNVLLAGAGASSPTDCRFTDVRDKLIATGLVGTVDIHVATSAGSTPTLAQLQNYDVVFTWSNFQWGDAAAMGNVLADYVDAGGGVVVAVFANASIPLAGRWVTEGYEVIIGGSGQTQGSVTTLGTVLDPSHPIMAGVSTFSGGSQSFRPTVTALTAGSTTIAEWSDGRVLIAVGSNPRRVDLGFYPPSGNCVSSFWDPTTDGARLMANALVFAAGSTGPTCYANCDESTQAPILNVADFGCFLSKFAAGDLYANCDESTQPPVLNVADFGCFLGKFAAGCP